MDLLLLDHEGPASCLHLPAGMLQKRLALPCLCTRRPRSCNPTFFEVRVASDFSVIMSSLLLVASSPTVVDAQHMPSTTAEEEEPATVDMVSQIGKITTLSVGASFFFSNCSFSLAVGVCVWPDCAPFASICMRILRSRRACVWMDIAAGQSHKRTVNNHQERCCNNTSADSQTNTCNA